MHSFESIYASMHRKPIIVRKVIFVEPMKNIYPYFFAKKQFNVLMHNIIQLNGAVVEQILKIKIQVIQNIKMLNLKLQITSMEMRGKNTFKL